MRSLGIFVMVLSMVLLLGGTGFKPLRAVSAVSAQETAPEYPWTGKSADGRVITAEDLEHLLDNHKKWLASTGKEGQRADQTGADLGRANLNGAKLRGADLHKADLSGADLSGADLYGANLRDADLKGADLSGAYLSGADLSGTNLKDANLKDAVLNKADLKEADLSGANLRLAGLGWANLRKSNLSGANLDKSFLRADLYGANLWGATLMEADLRRANLSRANLSRADLRKANLAGTILHGTDLSGADLRDADFRGAYLGDAIMAGADLRNASLGGANLSRADLRDDLFEPLPSSLPAADALATARGLAELRYEKYPQSLVKLRNSFKEAGYRQQEREIACSLKRSETWQEWQSGGLARIRAAFTLVFFGVTCNYGLSPWRPLMLLAGGILIFWPFYCLALVSRRPDTGIWRVWLPGRVLKEEGQEKPEKLTTRPPYPRPAAGRGAKVGWQLRRGLRALALGFSFSLVAAFSPGWREPGAGNWISRLQKKEYTLRPTGWVRTLAGVQSLTSAFLLALWAVLAVAGIVGQ